ncbi:hypothetical protein V6B08_18050 [Ferrovibrio sp. MS7]|uniref:hypothetical protein n=1 Tax=Ferrovibrio plantarum TaxID=3119164 RepID=UPI003135BEBD
MKRIVFADIEASALHRGFPIEFGWAWAESSHVEARSFLIAPTDRWLSPEYHWDPAAEHIHGIGMDMLRHSGKPVDAACRTINEALVDSEICFDTGAAGIDSRWLDQLYAESGVERVLRLAATSADMLTINSAHRLGIGDVSWTLLKKLAPPIPHAAAEDAAHWAWWQIAVERVAGAGFGGIADGSDLGLDVLRSVVGSIEIYSTGRARQIVQPDI